MTCVNGFEMKPESAYLVWAEHCLSHIFCDLCLCELALRVISVSHDLTLISDIL